eukprot:GHVU01091744.1.p1 GENE.GHVU01091744.1~~GHVU01091744.1.p1  ORF type:complete len:143 (+),score=6.02 GHVU01091744.1:270-698(+)
MCVQTNVVQSMHDPVARSIIMQTYVSSLYSGASLVSMETNRNHDVPNRQVGAFAAEYLRPPNQIKLGKFDRFDRPRIIINRSFTHSRDTRINQANTRINKSCLTTLMRQPPSSASRSGDPKGKTTRQPYIDALQSSSTTSSE